MERNDLEVVAARAVHLRGLKEVPFGLFLLLALGLEPLLPDDLGAAYELSWLLAVVLTVVASKALSAYYDRTFGQASNVGPHGLGVAAGIPVVAAVVIGFLIEVRIHDLGINVVQHGSAMACLFGLAMLLRYQLRRSVSGHHLPLWGGLAVLGALPVWGHGVAADPDVIVGQATLIMAFAFVVNGVLDHRVLVRTLGSLEVEYADHVQC